MTIKLFDIFVAVLNTFITKENYRKAGATFKEHVQGSRQAEKIGSILGAVQNAEDPRNGYHAQGGCRGRIYQRGFKECNSKQLMRTG
jgi:hypothetical protein